MTAKNFVIRKAAVLGAGVMGAQIAAHLANAKVPVVLFDLSAKEGPKNGIVEKAIAALKKQKPAPLAGKDAISYISAANYDDGLAELADCDLVIEAVGRAPRHQREPLQQSGTAFGRTHHFRHQHFRLVCRNPERKISR